MNSNTLSNSDTAKDTALIFVHGLSGSPTSTWSKMAACFSDDPETANVHLDFYAYPTALIRLPFTPPLPGLRDLAEGLNTFIEERHGSRKRIFIVAHSLGGLIVRQMLVSGIRNGKIGRIKKIALLAVPNTGATLANVGSVISFRHRQLKALCRDDDGLTTLNIDWDQLKVEDAIQVRYILGGRDRTVPPLSAVPYVGRNNRSVLINADHRSIVAPDDREDIRYQTVKRFLLDKDNDAPPTQQSATAFSLARTANPLFDVYAAQDEPFYVCRSFDTLLADVIGRGHVWLTGKSGVGKSAAARRAVYSSGWKLYHINLSGHEMGSSQELMASICSELSALCDNLPGPGKLSGAEQVSLAKRALMSLRSDSVIAPVIEEMPIGEERMVEAANAISNFLDQFDSDSRLDGQVRFVFSSINPVTSSSVGLRSKTLQKIQFLPVQPWSDFEIDRLVSLLSPAIKSSLTVDEQRYISRASEGSPRFVKMVFRHWQNGTCGNAPVHELCDRVAKELVF